MSNRTTDGPNLSTLDYVFAALSSKTTRLDFALVFHFTHSPSLEALNAGARSARYQYPTTSSLVSGRKWRYIETPDSGIQYASVTNANQVEVLIQNFLEGPFDLTVQLPYRQLFIRNPWGTDVLVSRFHHAVADGMSAAMWLGHQLRVALGLKSALEQPGDYCLPELRSSALSVRRSRFAYAKASENLWTPGTQTSVKRRWQSFALDSNDLRQGCRKAGGLTFNDLLAACALEMFSQWNIQKGGPSTSQVGLWFPINVRQRSTCGFGNGTSRIRLYPRYDSSCSIVEKARELRRQISWCTTNGEWVVPSLPFLDRIPKTLLGTALNFYLRRPSVDMATGIFSHAHSWVGGVGEVFQRVARIDAIGLLHPRQAVALNGTTLHGKTNLTLTYDSGLLSADDAANLVDLYQCLLREASKELSDAR